MAQPLHVAVAAVDAAAAAVESQKATGRSTTMQHCSDPASGLSSLLTGSHGAGPGAGSAAASVESPLAWLPGSPAPHL